MTAPLNYAPPPRRHPLRELLLIMAGPVIVVLLLGLGAWQIPRLIERYWWNRCLNYQAPPGQLVYEETPTRGYIYNPPEVNHLYSHFGEADVLLHGFRASQVVELLAFQRFGDPHHVYLRQDFWMLLDRASILTPMAAMIIPPPTITLAFTRDCRIYAAQLDPANPLHFTFLCQLDGVNHLYDGWLRTDGTALISERTPVATTPSPSSRAQSPPSPTPP